MRVSQDEAEGGAQACAREASCMCHSTFGIERRRLVIRKVLEQRHPRVVQPFCRLKHARRSL